MSLNRIHGATVALATFALLATACGGADGTTPETPSAQPSSTAETPAAPPPTSQIVGDEEPIHVLRGEAPKEMPDGITPYPNAKPETSLLIPGRGGLVTFSSDDSIADIIGFYQQDLKEQGWSIDKVDEQELRTRITATRDGRLLDVVAARNGDNTEIMINTQDAG